MPAVGDPISAMNSSEPTVKRPSASICQTKRSGWRRSATACLGSRRRGREWPAPGPPPRSGSGAVAGAARAPRAVLRLRGGGGASVSAIAADLVGRLDRTLRLQRLGDERVVRARRYARRFGRDRRRLRPIGRCRQRREAIARRTAALPPPDAFERERARRSRRTPSPCASARRAEAARRRPPRASWRRPAAGGLRCRMNSKAPSGENAANGPVEAVEQAAHPFGERQVRSGRFGRRDEDRAASRPPARGASSCTSAGGRRPRQIPAGVRAAVRSRGSEPARRRPARRPGAWHRAASARARRGSARRTWRHRPHWPRRGAPSRGPHPRRQRRECGDGREARCAQEREGIGFAHRLSARATGTCHEGSRVNESLIITRKTCESMPQRKWPAVAPVNSVNQPGRCGSSLGRCLAHNDVRRNAFRCNVRRRCFTYMSGGSVVPIAEPGLAAPAATGGPGWPNEAGNFRNPARDAHLCRAERRAGAKSLRRLHVGRRRRRRAASRARLRPRRPAPRTCAKKP